MRKEKYENNGNQQLCDKILTLCISHEIQSSNLDLNIIMSQIKLCEIELSNVKDNKPLFFQKEKIKKYNEQIEIITRKIDKHYTELSEELDILYKLKDAI